MTQKVGCGQQFSDRIRIVRESAKLNKTEFANEIGVSQSHMSLLEASKSKPSTMLIKFVSLKFGINEQWLASGEGVMTPEITAQNRNKVRPIERPRVDQLSDLLPRFRDKEKARQFNLDLIEIERGEPGEYDFLRGQAVALARTIQSKKRTNDNKT